MTTILTGGPAPAGGQAQESGTGREGARGTGEVTDVRAESFGQLLLWVLGAAHGGDAALALATSGTGTAPAVTPDAGPAASLAEPGQGVPAQAGLVPGQPVGAVNGVVAPWQVAESQAVAVVSGRLEAAEPAEVSETEADADEDAQPASAWQALASLMPGMVPGAPGKVAEGATGNAGGEARTPGVPAAGALAAASAGGMEAAGMSPAATLPDAGTVAQVAAPADQGAVPVAREVLTAGQAGAPQNGAARPEGAGTASAGQLAQPMTTAGVAVQTGLETVSATQGKTDAAGSLGQAAATAGQTQPADAGPGPAPAQGTLTVPANDTAGAMSQTPDPGAGGAGQEAAGQQTPQPGEAEVGTRETEQAREAERGQAWEGSSPAGAASGGAGYPAAGGSMVPQGSSASPMQQTGGLTDPAAGAASPRGEVSLTGNEPWRPDAVLEWLARPEAVRETRDGLAVKLKLEPEHLGHLDLEVTWQGDAVSARFVVERGEAAAMLQQGFDRLAEALRAQGMEVATLEAVLADGTGRGGYQHQRERESNQAPRPEQPVAAVRPARALYGWQDVGSRIDFVA